MTEVIWLRYVERKEVDRIPMEMEELVIRETMPGAMPLRKWVVRLKETLRNNEFDSR